MDFPQYYIGKKGMTNKDKNKVKIVDAAIDAGYITVGEGARTLGQARQSVHGRTITRGVNAKERRQARIVKTLAEIGKLLRESKD